MKLFTILIAGIMLFAGSAMAQTDELVNKCALGIGNATYLKDYKVKLPASSVSPPTAKMTTILNKGTFYKLSVCNAEGSEGEAIIKLMENNTVLGTNLKPDGGFVTAIGFQCTKTGMYSIEISFKDGKEGSAVGILSYVNM